jgi:phosphate transport system substrate-binding protein
MVRVIMGIDSVLKRLGVWAVAAVFVVLELHSDEIQGRGATFPEPLYDAWIAEYHAKTGDKVNYIATSSGDGIKSIVNRECDFAGSDKPLNTKKLHEHKLYMFPSVIGSIVLAYNIPGVKDGELRLSEKAIVGIFSGKIKYWDDTEIIVENPELKLPHKKLTIAVRSDKSGTTYNFTYYLSKLNDKVFKVSKQPDWQGNILASKSNAGVSESIEKTNYSIGYVEYSYKQKLGLSAAQVQNKAGKYILPTLSSFQDAAKYASWRPENDFYALIAYPDGKRSYPIVAATFILLPQEKNINNKKVTKFINFAYRGGDKIATDLGYVPLPEETKELIRKYWVEKGIQ